MIINTFIVRSENRQLNDLGHKDWYHHIDLVSIVHIGVGHHIVVALGVDVQLVVVVVIVVDVVVYVCYNGQNIH